MTRRDPWGQDLEEAAENIINRADDERDNRKQEQS